MATKAVPPTDEHRKTDVMRAADLLKRQYHA
jgi:hypothetical protein